MKKYIKTYRNLILTAQVDYLHGFHHLDTLALNSGIWILFYMFNYVNFHSICIFFSFLKWIFLKGVQSDEVTFFFQLNEGHKFTFADSQQTLTPTTKNPLTSTIWNRLWNWFQAWRGSLDRWPRFFGAKDKKIWGRFVPSQRFLEQKNWSRKRSVDY